MSRRFPAQSLAELASTEGPDFETLPIGENSVKNTGPVRGADGRLRGGNPGNSGGKKGRSGRPPDWLKALMAEGREKAVEWALKKLAANKLTADQVLKIVTEWAPADEQGGQGWTLVMKDGEVKLIRNEVLVEPESGH